MLEWYSYSSNVREKKAKHLFSRKLTQQETDALFEIQAKAKTHIFQMKLCNFKYMY